jgi:hypothetical protein
MSDLTEGHIEGRKPMQDANTPGMNVEELLRHEPEMVLALTAHSLRNRANSLNGSAEMIGLLLEEVIDILGEHDELREDLLLNLRSILAVADDIFGITDAMVGYIQARGGAEEFYEDED